MVTVLLENMRLNRKGLPSTNSLRYFASSHLKKTISNILIQGLVLSTNLMRTFHNYYFGSGALIAELVRTFEVSLLVKTSPNTIMMT